MTECRNREAIRTTDEAHVPTEEPSTSGSEEVMPIPHPQKRKFSKQLSMCKSQQDIAWEKQRSRILRQERRKSSPFQHEAGEDLTDEDMKELKGFMDLGFRFSEEDGMRFGGTLPALDLYLAVNRQVCQSPVSTPHSARTSPASSYAGSPTRDDQWKICNPGDDPKQVKNKLRQWAQVVAFSVMHSH